MTRKRRIALWLRDHLERLGAWLDRKTVEPFDPDKWPALDISDEEWAVWEALAAASPEDER